MSKHIAIFERAKEIIRASRDLHNQQDFKFFYEAALRTLVALHPQASQQILTNIAKQFTEAGRISVHRQRDAIDIGMVSLSDSVTDP